MTSARGWDGGVPQERMRVRKLIWSIYVTKRTSYVNAPQSDLRPKMRQTQRHLCVRASLDQVSRQYWLNGKQLLRYLDLTAQSGGNSDETYNFEGRDYPAIQDIRTFLDVPKMLKLSLLA